MLRERGLRGLCSGRLLAFVATLTAAMAVFLVVSERANAGVPGWPDRANELAWYFGSLEERMSLDPHTTIVERILKQVLSVPVAFVTLLALFAVRQWPLPARSRSIVVVFGLGSVTTSLLFLHVNVVHGYYQLPTLVPLALLGGVGVAVVTEWLARMPRRWGPVAAPALLVVLAGVAVWSSERYLARLRAPSTAPLRAAGAFVRDHTMVDDFVLYARPAPDGANVHAEQSAAELRRAWHDAATELGGRLLLFVPNDCAAPAGAEQQLASGEAGRLFVLK